jgi:hypothetical protein
LSDYYARLKATQDKVNSEVTTGNNNCLTYALPFGEGNSTETRKLYISIRGTNGILNHADEVNYLDVNSVSNPHIYADQASRDKYILPLLNKTNTLYNVNYYRGWGSTHFHGVPTTDARNTTDEFLQYLKDKEADLWVDGFTRVAQYSQSYASHNLTVDAVAQTEIKFTVTDDMLDTAFDFPLTVKIRVANNWANISATQNGVSVDTKLISYNGNSYALVKAVPDAGQVILTGVEDDDPAIITPIEDQQVEEEKTLEVSFSASNTAGDNITFGIEGKPDFAVFTDNGDNTGKIVFSPQLYDKGVYDITITANNGTSTSSESFTLTVVDDGTSFTIKSDKNDASVYFPIHNFVDPNNRSNSISGGGYVDGKQMSSVFPFALPTQPSGLKVIDAKFSVNLEAVANVDAHLDLYGIYARTSSVVIVEDGYAGNFNDDERAVGIQENFVNKSTSLGVVENSSVSTSTLVEYLNNQYASSGAGSYIFLRLSTNDVNQAKYDRFIFTTADGAEENGGYYPTLTIKFGADLSNKTKEFSNLTVYPNPIKNGEINITSSAFKNTEVNIELYNISGQRVFVTQKNVKSENFNIQLNRTLNKGIYFLKIEGNNTVAVKKVLVE